MTIWYVYRAYPGYTITAEKRDGEQIMWSGTYDACALWIAQQMKG